MRSLSPCLLLLLAAAVSARAAKIDYDRDIRPILADNCTQCHGPDEAKRKGELRLDNRADALKEHDGVKAIVPGKPEASELVTRVLTTDPEEIMPPPKAKKTLTAAQKEKLRQWVAEGAEFARHWAFEPVRAVTPPAVSQTGLTGPTSAIDAFVLARLQQEKVAPSPEADRRTLCRRLCLDLTGLPPAPAEVEAFVADQAPNAYEKLVDRLLASPHYGERWGRHWLDLARYADSDGYEKDLPRPYAHLYRDWVIEAYNRDLPFDQFTIEQLAGDLLPNATLEQKTATGFQRQTLTNREGGVDKEEFRCKATVDRTSTVGTVWLGMSVGCAECHSHKFDPISQREFYQLYAFFNNASERDVPVPKLMNTEGYKTELAAWEKKRTAAEKPLADLVESADAALIAQWETGLKIPAEHWQPLKPTKLTAITEGAEEQFLPQENGAVMARSNDTARTRYRVAIDAPAGTRGFRIGALPVAGKVGTFKTGGFGLSEIYATVSQSGGEAQRLKIARAAVDTGEADAEKLIDGNRLTAWKVESAVDEPHTLVLELAEPLTLAKGAVLELNLEFFGGGVMNYYHVAATTDAGPLTPDTFPNELRSALQTRADLRTPAEKQVVARAYVERADPRGKKALAELAALDAKRPKPQPATVATLAADVRKTHIHIRGDFLQKGEEVQPGTPAFLPPMKPRGEAPDRLDLAQWLVDPANPLTARVTVNHVWQHLFGRGLVATENDFGTRGEKPSHPELLDCLAADFIKQGWSQKALIKEIVLSATYRQSSHWRADLADRDPLNVLLARQGRFRLEAEVVRDVNLAVSGLLNDKVGGPSIKPALPPDLAALNYAGGLKWTESTGAEKYRRGLYIHFQRTVPLPMLTTFDAPEASVTCTRRERSNTPLQALTMLNNSVSNECAQSFAHVLAKQTGGLPDQLRFGFQTALGRPPEEIELARLHAFAKAQKNDFEQAPDAAKQVVGGKAQGDAAAEATLVAVSRVLLNLDELITRE
jgi:mono/diheme cytochrome c family protein